MTTWLSDSSSESERPRIRLFTSGQATHSRTVAEKPLKNFEALVSANEQCRNCAHCPLSGALITDPVPHHSKDMN